MEISEQLKKIPAGPGIYLFYHKKELIYVGKATSLKDRVKSYFLKNKKYERPIETMIHQVNKIKYVETDSVLEAILREGECIKKFRPKYNILWKDDKSWNYIVLTRGEYPRLQTIRQHEKKNLTAAEETKMYLYIFGPYPGLKTKAALSILAKLFYVSNCKPQAKRVYPAQSEGRRRACLYYEMGQCLGVCVGEISPREYQQRVVKPLVMFLRGQKKRMLKNLQRQMEHNAAENNFEAAARGRDQLKALRRIQDVSLISKSFIEDKTDGQEDFRIEGYDISNLGATHKVGSLVVFDEDGPVKKDYKKFNIRTVVGQSDVDCLAEVLRRRLKHSEWPLPDVFLVDGGKPQVNIARKILKEFNLKLPIIGIAKGPKRDKNEFFVTERSREFLHWLAQNKILLVQARDEAHRFALQFSRSKRKIK